MAVRDFDAAKLKTMKNAEGLVLQGCGGDPQEWIDGINEMLTDEKILLDGTKFDSAIRFQHDGLTCLLFEFEKDMKMDMGRFAIWRLQTHDNFGGTWLSDYVPNKLGGFAEEVKIKKPDCPLIGEDGNIFNLMGLAAKTLKRNSMPEEAKQMQSRVMSCGSYPEALNIIGEYVNIVSADDMEQCEEMAGMNMQS
ncbi:MAG: hypothetical protein Q4C12_07650 [Clostridia bacterium]|nr:hypothetical protein [Clostridia bacterium]